MLYVGVDFGGTKIEAAALSYDGEFLSRQREPNPGNYEDAVRVVCDLIARVEMTVNTVAVNGAIDGGQARPRAS